MRIKDEQMQTQVLAVQLELDLWQNLKTARDEPETADIKQLWQNLEQVIEQSELDQQLRVAGDAIASIVEVYAIRANAILSALEIKDTKTEPILSEDFLSDLMRQSMSINLKDMMEDLFPSKPEPLSLVPTRGSVVVLIEKKTAHAIAQWMQRRGDGNAVSLIELQQALGMPLVEVWLGLLLSPVHQYNWETDGEFYNNAVEILLRHTQRS